MGYYWKPNRNAICELFEWLFADKEEKKIVRLVPKYCRSCEIMGICRDVNNNWKCRNGCQFMK